MAFMSEFPKCFKLAAFVKSACPRVALIVNMLSQYGDKFL